MLHNINIYCHICNNSRLYSVKDLKLSNQIEFNQGFL
jgi:hypothetical protein